MNQNNRKEAGQDVTFSLVNGGTLTLHIWKDGTVSGFFPDGESATFDLEDGRLLVLNVGEYGVVTGQIIDKEQKAETND